MVQFHSYNQYLRGYEHIKLTLWKRDLTLTQLRAIIWCLQDHLKTFYPQFPHLFQMLKSSQYRGGFWLGVNQATVYRGGFWLGFNQVTVYRGGF